MQAIATETATSAPASEKGLLEELQSFWSAMPGKAVAGALLSAWVLLFHFFGYTFGGRSASLFDWMWGKWSDPANDASHGKLIPFVVLAMLWYRRDRLLRAVSGVWWPGLAALAFALLLHALGVLVQQPRLSMIALFGGAWVLLALVWGWEFGKATFFPCAIFAFCVPMGGTFAQGLTLPLRLLAAKWTTCVTHNALDVDVIRDGTQLLDPQARWRYDVAAACSGIRSFIALLAITTILAGLTMKSLWKKVVIVALSIPLALLCNVLRLSTVILAANAFKAQAAGDFVDHYFGYVTYGVAVLCVLLVGRWLRGPAPGGIAMKRDHWVVLAAALGMMAATALGVARIQQMHVLGPPGVKLGRVDIFDDHNTVVATNGVLLPSDIPGFKSKPRPITSDELNGLPRDTTFGRRIYLNPAQDLEVQLTTVLMGTDHTSIHQPQYCLVAQGWNIVKSERVLLPMDPPYAGIPAMKLTANCLRKLTNGQTLNLSCIYVYWFVSGKQITSDEGSRLWSVASSMLKEGEIERWAYISYFAPCLPGHESITFDKLREFIRASAPEFQLVRGAPIEPGASTATD